MNFFTASLVAVLSAAIGSMGLGGGGVLLLYLTAFASYPQLQAQVINLIFFIPTAIISLIIHTKHKLVRWRFALIACPFGVAGVCLGTYLSSIIAETNLSKIFAGFLLILGLCELFRKKKKDE